MSRQQCNDLIDSACFELVDYCDNLLKDFHERTAVSINGPCTCGQAKFVQQQHSSETSKKKDRPRVLSCNTCKQWYYAIKNAHVHPTIDTSHTDASQWSCNRFEVLRAFVTGQRATLTSFADADSSVMLCFLEHFSNTPSLIRKRAKTVRSQFRNQSAHTSVAGAARPLDIDALTNVLAQLLETAQLPDAARNVRGSSILIGQHRRRRPLPSTRPPSEQLQAGLNSMLTKLAREHHIDVESSVDAWPIRAVSGYDWQESEIDSVVDNVVDELASATLGRSWFRWLHGDPGSGKTVTLVSVAHKLRDDINGRTLLPIFVELGNVFLTVDMTPAKLEQELINEFVRNICAECPELSTSVRKLVQERVDDHAAVFLCDAFDELHAVMRQPESHGELARLFLTWTRKNERSAIVTCRNAIDESLGAVSIRFVPMSTENLRAAFQWFFGRHPTLPVTYLGNILTYMLEDNLSVLVANTSTSPFFVHLIGYYVLRRIETSVVDSSGHIAAHTVVPGDIPELLTNYMSDLLSRAHTECTASLTSHEMRRFVTATGFVLVRDGLRNMPRVDLKVALANLAVWELNKSNDDYNAVINALVRAQLLVDDWSGSIRVFHRSICEYLATLYIAESANDNAMRCALRDSDLWAEVLVQLLQLGQPAVVERVCAIATGVFIGDDFDDSMSVDEHLEECLSFLDPAINTHHHEVGTRSCGAWLYDRKSRSQYDSLSQADADSVSDAVFLPLEECSEEGGDNHDEDAWRRRWVFKHFLGAFSRGFARGLPSNRLSFGERVLRKALDVVQKWKDVESYEMLALGVGCYPPRLRNEILIRTLGCESVYLRGVAAKKACDLQLACEPELESALAHYAGDVTVDYISTFPSYIHPLSPDKSDVATTTRVLPQAPAELVRLQIALAIGGRHEADLLWHSVRHIQSSSRFVFLTTVIFAFILAIVWTALSIGHCKHHECITSVYVTLGIVMWFLALVAVFGYGQAAVRQRAFLFWGIVIALCSLVFIFLAAFVASYELTQNYSQMGVLGPQNYSIGNATVTFTVFFEPCLKGSHIVWPGMSQSTYSNSSLGPSVGYVSCCEGGHLNLLSVERNATHVLCYFRSVWKSTAALPRLVWLMGSMLCVTLNAFLSAETMRGFVTSRWRWCHNGFVMCILTLLNVAPLVSWACRRRISRRTFVPTRCRKYSPPRAYCFISLLAPLGPLLIAGAFLGAFALVAGNAAPLVAGLCVIGVSTVLSICVTCWMQKRLPPTLDDSCFERCNTLTLLALHPSGRGATAFFVAIVLAMAVIATVLLSPYLNGDEVIFGICLLTSGLASGSLAGTCVFKDDGADASATDPIDTLLELEEVSLTARRLDVCLNRAHAFSNRVTSRELVIPADEYVHVCGLWRKYRQRDPGVATALEDVMLAMVQRKEATWAKKKEEAVVGELEASTREGNVDEEEE